MDGTDMAHQAPTASTADGGIAPERPGSLICVTAAACVDRYLRVPGLRTGQINRPTAVVAQAGGKGVNVARFGRVLATDVTVVGLLDDASGARFHRELAELGIRARWACTSTEGRECLCIYDDGSGELTELYEPIPPVPPPSWPELRRCLRESLTEATADTVVTISGRMPDGLPDESLAEMIDAAHQAGLRVLVDSDDHRLLPALPLRPHLVKINAAEAARLTGLDVRDVPTGRSAAEALLDRGARSVVITMGSSGSLYIDGDRQLLASAPRVRPTIPVGSGDAFLAGFAAGLSRGATPEQAQRLAAAAAAATAETLVVGDVRARRVHRLAPGVEIRETPQATTDWSTR
ncbi:MAG: hexose kinase [Pseudonocardiaceae bacterium]|nr:hexose kinase [Pseudonocardiaceae bacterium]